VISTAGACRIRSAVIGRLDQRADICRADEYGARVGRILQSAAELLWFGKQWPNWFAGGGSKGQEERACVVLFSRLRGVSAN
jgi:hypothetical protein